MTVIKSSAVRKALRILLPFLVVPAVIVGGAILFRGSGYSYISLAVVLLAILFFISGFERKETGTRRIIIIAVMTALAVTGRFVFLSVPAITPITAVAAITAIYLGGEAGFLVGALSALISNMFAGHGVWTPFQMFAWGLTGLFAGLLSKYLLKSKVLLCTYGVLSGILYSFLMDTWTVLWYNKEFKLSLFLAAVVTAIPHTATYAISNALFLLLMAKPFGEKLGRIKTKYGV